MTSAQVLDSAPRLLHKMPMDFRRHQPATNKPLRAKPASHSSRKIRSLKPRILPRISDRPTRKIRYLTTPRIALMHKREITIYPTNASRGMRQHHQTRRVLHPVYML
jgi:hypothetical protein